MSNAYIHINRERFHAALHALSQPLTVVSLALSLVQSSQDGEERTTALEAAVSECQRAMRSVHQLRSLLDECVQLQRHSTLEETTVAASAACNFGGTA